MHNKERNRRLTERASQQHGLISREQALNLKFSPSGIHRRVRSGQWKAIRPGVYRVGPVASSWHQELMAACLWIGPEAVASHTSAAALLKLDGVPFPAIEVTTSKARNPERTGVVVHRSQSLPTEDKTVERLSTWHLRLKGRNSSLLLRMLCVVGWFRCRGCTVVFERWERLGVTVPGLSLDSYPCDNQEKH